MITSRRIRERQAAEASGQPPPAPSLPTEVPRHEHQATLGELAAARAEANGLRERARLAGVFEARVAELERDNRELRTLLEDATRPSSESAEASSDGEPAPKPSKTGRGGRGGRQAP